MAAQTLRVGFAGTPEFAAKHLQALLQHGFDVPLVLTQPDRPAGRGKKLMPSPTKIVAEAANIPVWQPTSLKDDLIQKTWRIKTSMYLLLLLTACCYLRRC